jgi:uncharacterized protein (TIGR03066 family)
MEKLMKRILALVVSLAVLVVSVDGVSADKKPQPNKEKVIGAWKMTKTTWSDTEAVGGTYEFSKDGKINYTDKAGTVGVAKGTYEVDGDTLKMRMTTFKGEKADNKTTTRIKSLMDKEMVLAWQKNDRTYTMHFTKVKQPRSAPAELSLDSMRAV